jgi:hypothetical protein
MAAVQHLQAGSERVASALERGGGEHARRRAHLHQRRAQSVHDSPSAVCVCASHPSAAGRQKQPHLLQGSSVRRRATAAKDVAVEVGVARIQALEVRGEKLDPAYAQRVEARGRRYSSADAAERKYSPSKAQAPVASSETPATQEATSRSSRPPPSARTHSIGDADTLPAPWEARVRALAAGGAGGKRAESPGAGQRTQPGRPANRGCARRLCASAIRTRRVRRQPAFPCYSQHDGFLEFLFFNPGTSSAWTKTARIARRMTEMRLWIRWRRLPWPCLSSWAPRVRTASQRARKTRAARASSAAALAYCLARSLCTLVPRPPAQERHQLIRDACIPPEVTKPILN